VPPLRLEPLLLTVVLAAAPAPPGPALAAAAPLQLGVTVRYDPAWRRLAYPGGDVPQDRGVCTDVVVRAYRRLGVDLQVLVHEDLAAAWGDYPHPWPAKGPDPSIDHRRVPNLARFFERRGASLPCGTDRALYLPGDVVTWFLPSGVPHMGLVAGPAAPGRNPLVIHNLGQGVQVEDVLFAFRITGHYRYWPAGRDTDGVIGK
jgi:uncharacterized protein